MQLQARGVCCGRYCVFFGNESSKMFLIFTEFFKFRFLNNVVQFLDGRLALLSLLKSAVNIKRRRHAPALRFQRDVLLRIAEASTEPFWRDKRWSSYYGTEEPAAPPTEA